MSETILLVEDDDAVRRLLGRVLRGRGYQVLEASSGEDAQSLFAAHEGTVHLLIADIIMSGLSGPELAKRLLAQARDLRLLYMSGYPEKQVLAQCSAVPAAFMHKPFTPGFLVDQVRQILEPVAA